MTLQEKQGGDEFMIHVLIIWNLMLTVGLIVVISRSHKHSSEANWVLRNNTIYWNTNHDTIHP